MPCFHMPELSEAFSTLSLAARPHSAPEFIEACCRICLGPRLTNRPLIPAHTQNNKEHHGYTAIYSHLRCLRYTSRVSGILRTTKP